MNSLSVSQLLNKFESNYKPLSNPKELDKIRHSANGTFELGKDKTKLYQSGRGTVNDESALIFQVTENGKFSDFTGDVKSEEVLIGEKLYISPDSGKLLAIESKPNGQTGEDAAKLLGELIKSQAPQVKANTPEKFKSWIDSCVKLVMSRDPIMESSDIKKYGDKSRKIIKDYSSK